jgi:EAL domain-containing protein (putative c-di-GMP-specific phosphodiesterase class I)/FixJ family two-component response regulator
MLRPSVHIIDDDENICAEISSALVASGYDCSWATCADHVTGTEAYQPDILLLDLNLPGVDGFQIIRKLAESQRPPHLIVASGHEQRIIEAAIRFARALGLNVLGSLHKPFPVRSLLALLQDPAGAPRPVHGADTPSVRKLVQNGAMLRDQQTAFQSKHRLQDGAITGYEALLRVEADGVPINPAAIFVPEVDLADQIALTQAVLDDALRFACGLRLAGDPVPVSVNCTPAILCAPELPDMVFRALDRWRVPASSLMIEITENEAVETFDAIIAAACRIAMRGCGISIDDYGRGTTSLERLFNLPLTEVKIDKEIFWKCAEGREPAGLLREVVRYCESREITSTVEGIETRAHLKQAIDLGAGCGQGFLWDRPSLKGHTRAAADDHPRQPVRATP